MKRYTFLFVSLLVALSMVLAACQPAVETEPPAVEEPTEEPVEEPTEEPVVEPTEEPTEEGPAEVQRVEGMGAPLDRVVVSVVDSASAVTQIVAGAIDIYAGGLSSATLPEIEEAGLEYGTGSGLYYELTLNPVGPIFETTGAVNPFFDKRAREALNWMVDRDYINREVYNGGALAKFFHMVTQFPDYATLAPKVRELEAKYAYDFERGVAQMDEVMLGIAGVTKEDGMYMYNGEQVTLIMLIRNDSDGTRVPIGDYVGNQMEQAGFATERLYRSSSEASPIWVGGNPADGQWHIYTGAWSATIIDRDEGDNFQFFDCPASAYGFTALWQAFNPSEYYQEQANKLAYNLFETREDRNEAMAEMLELGLEESVHVWLIDGKNFIPYVEGLDVTYDLAAGVDGSMIWPYTLAWKDQVGGTVNWGQPDLFVDPWNPIAGSNWAFDQAVGRATWGEAYMIDPHTGLLLPQRFERAEITAKEGLPIGKTMDYITLDFEPEIQVPDDAIMDWDAEAVDFITAADKLVLDAEAAQAALDEAIAAEETAPAAVEEAQVALDTAQAALDELADDASDEDKEAAQLAVDDATAALEAAQAALEGAPDVVAAAEEALAAAQEKEYYTAQVKSVVYYPEELWTDVKWHDGSLITLADFLHNWIISLDMGKEGSPIFDDSYASNAAAILANFKGFRILSEDPLVIEAFSDYYEIDAELNITTLWPSFSYGEAPWHMMAMGSLGDIEGTVAFSADKADAESTDTQTVEWLSFIGGPSLDILNDMADKGIEEQFIPYANVLADYITPEEAVARYENAKAFYEEYGHFNIGTGPYILEEVFLTEKVATLVYFPDFPDPTDKWYGRYGAPKVAEVVVEGPATLIVGEETVFDVFVDFEGEAYEADEIKSVTGLLYDGTGLIVDILEAELVEDGYYTITVPAELSAEMEAGASKLEAVVVPFTVAIPSFQALEFVTVE
ncbi:MAG: ABC transporter substrate-binding protein [Brevefilum sp.]|nr:ABC transporter substrate-binding protein [Brevefilum sp.]MDT8382490.1 ABC transporter substrate-binding protein [Brevefilum sp.]MDW7753715.1 ABC transporter substrate-binding protein [Brevefilum sp.]